jgi:hypothetical protein
MTDARCRRGDVPSVLFLDIDGVLNCRGTPGSTWQKLDPVMVARLNRVMRAVHPLVVLSSCWGLAQGRTERELRRAGFIGRLVDQTPGCGPEACRGEEIWAWLVSHPGVSQFAILDDGADMGSLRAHLVQTSFEEGLQDRHVDELIGRLA